jgi:superfamily II DNA or RNA helicase
METFNDSRQKTISLRPYQQEALTAIADAESRGIRRQLVALPTGTGKTVIFAHLLQQRRVRALVLAHRDELIEQAASKIRTIDPTARVGICKAERRGILARFKSGETVVVSNCAVLTEGYDEPSIDCVIMARPTQSRPLYIQMVGRGTRIFPGKSNCLILDLVGATSRHKLVTAATLFNLDAHRLADMDADEALKERDSSGPRTLDIGPSGGQRVAREVALFGRERLNTWEPFDDGCWRMNVAGQTIFIRPYGTDWTVRVSRGDECRSLASGLSLEYAQI